MHRAAPVEAGTAQPGFVEPVAQLPCGYTRADPLTQPDAFPARVCIARALDGPDG